MQPDKPTEQPEVTPPATPITPDSQPPQPPAPGKNKKRRFPIWAIITLSVVGFLSLVGILIGIVATTVSKSSQQPVDESVAFVKTLQSGNTAEAYEMTTSNFRKVVPNGRFERMIEEMAPRLQGDITVTDRSTKTFRGVTTNRILMEISGSPKTFIEVSVVREDDTFKINDIDFDDIPFEANAEK